MRFSYLGVRRTVAVDDRGTSEVGDDLLKSSASGVLRREGPELYPVLWLRILEHFVSFSALHLIV